MRGRAAARLAGSALRGLRAYWGTALLAVAAGTVALGASLPVTQLATWSAGIGTRLRLPAGGLLDAGFEWIRAATGPADLRRDAVGSLFGLLAAVTVGLVVVALLTLVALFAARASARGREIAIRRAVGASSRALLVTHLVEGAMIGAAALLAGGAVGLAAGRALGAAWPGSLAPPAGHPGLAVALAVAGALVLGSLLPVALVRRPAKSSAVDPTSLGLVVPALQLGLSLTVLAAAAMLRRGAERVAPAGAAAGAGDLVFEIHAAGMPAAQRAAGYGGLLHRLRSDHAVALASLSSPGALVGLGSVAAAVDVTAESAFYSVHCVLSADSFHAMGLRLLAGRWLADADGPAAPRAAVVNRSFAMHFGGVGGTLFLGYGPDARHTVVGVVDDARAVGLGATLAPRFVVYTSVLQHPAADAELLVRSRGAPDAAGLRAAIGAALGPGVSADGPVTAAALFDAEAAPLRWFSRAFGVEGWAMLALATFGTFAVMWLWVASLLGELGLRRAAGARRPQVRRYVLARAAAVAAWGTAVGAWVGMMVWDAVHRLAETLPAWDPGAVVRSSVLLGAAALAGAYVPAWRAARERPAALMAGEG